MHAWSINKSIRNCVPRADRRDLSSVKIRDLLGRLHAYRNFYGKKPDKLKHETGNVLFLYFQLMFCVGWCPLRTRCLAECENLLEKLLGLYCED